MWAIISVILIITSLLYDKNEFIAFLWEGVNHSRKNIVNVDFRQNALHTQFP